MQKECKSQQRFRPPCARCDPATAVCYIAIRYYVHQTPKAGTLPPQMPAARQHLLALLGLAFVRIQFIKYRDLAHGENYDIAWCGRAVPFFSASRSLRWQR